MCNVKMKTFQFCSIYRYQISQKVSVAQFFKAKAYEATKVLESYPSLDQKHVLRHNAFHTVGRQCHCNGKVSIPYLLKTEQRVHLFLRIHSPYMSSQQRHKPTHIWKAYKRSYHANPLQVCRLHIRLGLFFFLTGFLKCFFNNSYIKFIDGSRCDGIRTKVSRF